MSGKKVEPGTPYREVVGSLLRLASGCRPDISCAVSTVTRYCNNPHVAHWQARKMILRYLACIQDYDIHHNAKYVK